MSEMVVVTTNNGYEILRILKTYYSNDNGYEKIYKCESLDKSYYRYVQEDEIKGYFTEKDGD